MQFAANLKGIQLIRYVEGTVTLDDPLSLQQDQIILGWLLSSISPTILASVMSCEASFEVWETLKCFYASDSKARMLSLKQRLQHLRKGNKSVAEYIADVSEIVDSLTIVGEKIN